MDETPLRLERRGAVAILRLNRPEVGNAIDLPLANALLQAIIDADEDPSARCVVLTGEGRFFCVGGDVNGFGQAGDRLPAMLKGLTAPLHAAIAKLTRMGKPVVTAINGPAAGAGFSLAMLGDIAIARRSAHFTLAYTGIGLSPDGGASWLLPRLVGLRRAQELALTNRRVGAEEAEGIGLLTRVVDDERFDEEIAEVADTLARSATFAAGAVRRLLLQSTQTSLEAQMEAEAQAIAEAARTPHGREGVAAFLAKRKPNFE